MEWARWCLGKLVIQNKWRNNRKTSSDGWRPPVFCGAATMASFKLPKSGPWRWIWEEMCRQFPQSASYTPLSRGSRGRGEEGWCMGGGGEHPERARQVNDRWGPQLPRSLPWSPVPVAAPRHPLLLGFSPPAFSSPWPGPVTGFNQQAAAGGMLCIFWGSAWSKPGGFCSCTRRVMGCCLRSPATLLQQATWEGHARKQKPWQGGGEWRKPPHGARLGPQTSDPLSS